MRQPRLRPKDSNPMSAKRNFPAAAQRAQASSPWAILALVVPVYVMTMFYRMAPSILAPSLARDFGVGMAELATLSGATFLSYGLMQLPSGLLADAIGGRRTVCLITVFAGLGNLGFAMASSVEGASAARFLVGVGSAVCVPCVAMLALHFPPAMFSRVNGILLAMGTAGTALAGAPLALAAEQIGWRAVMAVSGIGSLSFAALVWLLVKEPVPVGRQRSVGGHARRMFRGLAGVLRRGRFWPLCLWYSLLVGLYFSVGGLWWGPYLMEGCGLSEDQAGSVISLAYMVAILGQPFLAALSEFFRSRKKILVGCTLAALAATSILPVFGAHMPPWALTLQGIIFTVAAGMVGAVAFASAREMFPLRVAGTAIGCLQTLPYLVMTPLIQKLFGLALEFQTSMGVAQASAYARAQYVNIAVIVLALMAILLTKETFQGKAPSGQEARAPAPERQDG